MNFISFSNWIFQIKKAKAKIFGIEILIFLIIFYGLDG